MPLTLDQLTNGLTPEHDYFFPHQPADPEMRESTSIWMYEENGAFGFPRIGIEAEAHAWDNRMYQANINLGGGRILIDNSRGAGPSAFGPDGRATVLGAGPLTFRCIEPFRRWQMSFDGTAQNGTLAQQIDGTLNTCERIPVKLDVEMTMATPAWVQDYSPETYARMSPADQANAQCMGIGWRLEHLFRGVGTLTVDGQTREFRAVGSRIKRQSVRPLDAFRGHCWQSALFPDGRAFGFIAYPANPKAPEFQIAYVYMNGKMYPAKATKIPYIRQVLEEGDDVSLELQSELGTHHISASTTLNTFKVNNPEMAALGATGFTLQQGGARYTWDGMTSYGMIERSALGQQMAEGYGA
jgi:hypothetical protein